MVGYPEEIHSDYLQLITNNLAHELKSSLVAIKSGVKGVKKYLPALLTAYEEATSHHLNVPAIPVRHVRMLSQALEFAERAAYCASHYVSMFAMNMSKIDKEKLFLENCSILDCLQESIDVYPYRSEDEQSYCANAIQTNQDFLFKGDKTLVVNLLMNLLRNIIYRIRDAGRGKIIIWTEIEESCQCLFIKDTSKKVDRIEQEFMFVPFRPLHQHDLGMGLFFCKQLMQTLGGDIVCCSNENHSTEFKLIFPTIDNTKE